MQNHHTRLTRCYILLMLTVSVTLAGCTRDKASTNDLEIPVGKPAYSFDWKKSHSLTLAKADPSTGDHWMVRIERVQERPESFFENDPWKIQAYSENTVLEDQLANRTLILHLIDTLTTFRANEAVKTNSDSDSETGGPSEATRASYGLSPPRYAIQWQAMDPQGVLRTFQAEIGNPVDSKQDSSKEAYGTFPPSRKIFKVDGAALAMLDYAKDFSSLRQSQLSPLGSDDIDEMEIEIPHMKPIYAQREGDRWTNKAHQPWKKDMAGFLDRITHLRIQKFIDAETEASPLRKDLENQTLARIILKDRYGKPTTFRFARSNHRAVADVSSRGRAVFELYPEALSKLTP